VHKHNPFSADGDDVDRNNTSATDIRDTSVVSGGKTVSPTAFFQSAVLTVMFKEKQTQEIRNRNFVIHGLQDIPSDNDKEHVQQRCEAELNLKLDINTCKRLGKIIPGKVVISCR